MIQGLANLETRLWPQGQASMQGFTVRLLRRCLLRCGIARFGCSEMGCKPAQMACAVVEWGLDPRRVESQAKNDATAGRASLLAAVRRCWALLLEPTPAFSAGTPEPILRHERDSVKFFKYSSLALAVLAAGAIPAMASITVYSPANNGQVSTPFTLNALAQDCSGQPVSAMGFSLDSSSDTTVVKSTSIDASVSASTGSHTLHVKAWGDGGAACVSDVAVTVGAGATSTSGISVSSPGNNTTVSSPFPLSATAVTCSSQPVSAMGYSIDYGSTTVVNSTSIQTNVSSSTGTHTLHVKAWGNAGASCSTNIGINVGTQSTSTSSTSSTGSTSTSSLSGTTIQGITVASPGNNATVGSPFVLNASASYCSSQAVTAMGYSLDSSADTAIVQSTSVAASVSASAGAHTLHVKSWGNGGAGCAANIAINVGSGTSTSTSTSTTSTSGVTISAPLNGASVASPFTVSGSAPTCSSQAVTAIGYSIDGGATTISSGTSINTQASAGTGSHTVHFKAWNGAGTVCTADAAINVTSSSTATSSVVPSNAVSVSSIQALNGWTAQYDPGTNGSSSGWMSLVSSPSLSGNARQFNTSFSNSAGELYHVTFGDDTSATNFFYDGWVYIANSSSNIANIEMDMNQVMPNGQTAIFGFQCDGYSSTWDYTENAGSPWSPNDQWRHSGAYCNPRSWSINQWHHVQISYSRNDSGYVTYHSVWLDGKEGQISATVPSAFALGWAPALVTNFQIDGIGSGSNQVYLDKLTVSRW